MSLIDCCAPVCATPQTTAIPGPPGTDGTPGTPGTPGVSAFTTLTANLTLPNVAQNVTASVADSDWMVVGQPIFIAGPANFTVVSIPSTTSVILRFSGSTGDLPPGSVLLAGSGVSVGSNTINAFTTTIADFTVPAVGAPVTVNVANTQWMGVGQELLIPGAGIFTVTSVTDSTTVVLTYGNFNGNTNSGNNVVAGAQVVVTGTDGKNAYSTTTSTTTIPAIGANVTANVVSSDFMAVGQIVILSETATPALGNFQVVSFPNSQSVVLKFLGYPTDSAPAVVIASGARASIAGILQSTSIGSFTAYGSGTAYALTTTPALIAMGTTTPSLTITTPGTYLILGFATYGLVGVGTGTSVVFTTQVQRTNNGPGTVANSLKAFSIGGTVGSLGCDENVSTPPVIYVTANSNDIVQLWASESVAPGSGTATISAATLIALKLA